MRRSQRSGELAIMGRKQKVVPVALDLLHQREHLVGILAIGLPVGSSASTRAGCSSGARAIATRCFWPPEAASPIVPLAQADALEQHRAPRSRPARVSTDARGVQNSTFSRRGEIRRQSGGTGR